VIGKVLQVPCRDILFDNVDSWAVPIKDSGIFTMLEFVPKAGDFVDQPTYDSFSVFRIRDKMSNSYWWIYGTQADFLASCSTCCGDAAVPMPAITDDYVIRIAPCQEFCTAEEDGTFKAFFAIPSLSGNLRYFPYGSFNNTAFNAASATGYATPTDLQTFLNANWINIGDPQVTIQWTITDGTIVGVFTGASAGDSVCMSVITVDPSA
jgi:hypothetical protein